MCFCTRQHCLLYFPSPEITPLGRFLKAALIFPLLPSLSHKSMCALTWGNVIGRVQKNKMAAKKAALAHTVKNVPVNVQESTGTSGSSHSI